MKDLNISDILGQRYVILQGFFVDSEGKYYLKDTDYMICFDSDGNTMWETDNRALGINKSYAAVCVDDVVYLSCQKNDCTYITEIDSQNRLPTEEYLLEEIGSQDIILAMDQGTDSDLLLYGAVSGIWAWNREASRLENRVSGSELNVPYGETVIARKFLPDGRLLLVKNVSEGDNLTGVTFQYIPAGK